MGPNQTNSRRTNRQHTERSSDSGGRSEQRGGGSVPDPPRRGEETRREGSGSEVCGAPCACSAMYAMEEGRRGTASVSFMCAATVVIAEKRGSEGKAKKFRRKPSKMTAVFLLLYKRFWVKSSRLGMTI